MTNRTERDQLMFLLKEDGTKLINLRCFRGTGGSVTTEEICRQLRSAIEQRRNGSAIVSGSFNDDAPKVDVRGLIAGLRQRG